MGPFSPSFGFVYIFVVVDYVSKWVEALATRTNDYKIVVKFVQEHTFCRHRTLEFLLMTEVVIFVTALLRLYLENIW